MHTKREHTISSQLGIFFLSSDSGKYTAESTIIHHSFSSPFD